MNLLPSPDETLDTFFNGKLQITQKKKGYRFSMDAVLLSQFIKIRKNERVMDLGTGCGILPLLLSHTTKAKTCCTNVSRNIFRSRRESVALIIRVRAGG